MFFSATNQPRNPIFGYGLMMKALRRVISQLMVCIMICCAVHFTFVFSIAPQCQPPPTLLPDLFQVTYSPNARLPGFDTPNPDISPFGYGVVYMTYQEPKFEVYPMFDLRRLSFAPFAASYTFSPLFNKLNVHNITQCIFLSASPGTTQRNVTTTYYYDEFSDLDTISLTFYRSGAFACHAYPLVANHYGAAQQLVRGVVDANIYVCDRDGQPTASSAKVQIDASSTINMPSLFTPIPCDRFTFSFTTRYNQLKSTKDSDAIVRLMKEQLILFKKDMQINNDNNNNHNNVSRNLLSSPTTTSSSSRQQQQQQQQQTPVRIKVHHRFNGIQTSIHNHSLWVQPDTTTIRRHTQQQQQHQHQGRGGSTRINNNYINPAHNLPQIVQNMTKNPGSVDIYDFLVAYDAVHGHHQSPLGSNQQRNSIPHTSASSSSSSSSSSFNTQKRLKQNNYTPFPTIMDLVNGGGIGNNIDNGDGNSATFVNQPYDPDDIILYSYVVNSTFYDKEHDFQLHNTLSLCILDTTIDTTAFRTYLLSSPIYNQTMKKLLNIESPTDFHDLHVVPSSFPSYCLPRTTRSVIRHGIITTTDVDDTTQSNTINYRTKISSQLSDLLSFGLTDEGCGNPLVTGCRQCIDETCKVNSDCASGLCLTLDKRLNGKKCFVYSTASPNPGFIFTYLILSIVLFIIWVC